MCFSTVAMRLNSHTNPVPLKINTPISIIVTPNQLKSIYLSFGFLYFFAETSQEGCSYQLQYTLEQYILQLKMSHARVCKYFVEGPFTSGSIGIVGARSPRPRSTSNRAGKPRPYVGDENFTPPTHTHNGRTAEMHKSYLKN